MEKLNALVVELYAALAARLRREEGQDFAEYALIFTLVVLVAVVAFSPLGGAIKGAIENVSAQF